LLVAVEADFHAKRAVRPYGRLRPAISHRERCWS
jgi:hypothetical protein